MSKAWTFDSTDEGVVAGGIEVTYPAHFVWLGGFFLPDSVSTVSLVLMLASRSRKMLSFFVEGAG